MKTAIEKIKPASKGKSNDLDDFYFPSGEAEILIETGYPFIKILAKEAELPIETFFEDNIEYTSHCISPFSIINAMEAYRNQPVDEGVCEWAMQPIHLGMIGGTPSCNNRGVAYLAVEGKYCPFCGKPVKRI